MPGLVIPAFASKRDEVRWKVRHLNLCALDRETRQAAAADPAIVWDVEARQYRVRRRSDPPRLESVGQCLDPADAPNAAPPPPLATGGDAEREAGGRKVLDRPASRPAGAMKANANTQKPRGL